MADKWNAAATNSQITRKYWQASGMALSITRVGNFMKKWVMFYISTKLKILYKKGKFLRHRLFLPQQQVGLAPPEWRQTIRCPPAGNLIPVQLANPDQ